MNTTPRTAYRTWHQAARHPNRRLHTQIRRLRGRNTTGAIRRRNSNTLDSERACGRRLQEWLACRFTTLCPLWLIFCSIFIGITEFWNVPPGQTNKHQRAVDCFISGLILSPGLALVYVQKKQLCFKKY